MSWKFSNLGVAEVGSRSRKFVTDDISSAFAAKSREQEVSACGRCRALSCVNWG